MCNAEVIQKNPLPHSPQGKRKLSPSSPKQVYEKRELKKTGFSDYLLRNISPSLSFFFYVCSS
jgi:hypothetical protein